MKQLTEDYVSYEIAKLLKEKGFDGRENHCHTGYFNGNLIDYTLFGFCDGEITLAPTMQMALKWLREVHKLHIKAGYDIQLKWYYDIISLKETVSFDYEEMKCYHNEFYFDSYEQAVEAAIKYTLENLI